MLLFKTAQSRRSTVEIWNGIESTFKDAAILIENVFMLEAISKKLSASTH